MNISDVAKKTGLTSKAIRFYEEKGLVTPPLRSENGYRTYSQQHLDELTLLRQARQVGFNLEECRELVALFNDPSRHSADVKRRTLEKVAEIERHIRRLPLAATGSKVRQDHHDLTRIRGSAQAYSTSASKLPTIVSTARNRVNPISTG